MAYVGLDHIGSLRLKRDKSPHTHHPYSQTPNFCIIQLNNVNFIQVAFPLDCDSIRIFSSQLLFSHWSNCLWNLLFKLG
ncbi:hypothetical protein L6452_18819 [Arctium lappa]|uniref:Uncharacterized protein n=1 Tax=Arctium lappa TaxID=4217 RepID=A0ACB9C7J4_ARCLA|nr:hypothetical protein L6452_18819 [Arctium lappa]